MIARIWRTGLDPARANEYERFAADRSLPMFRRQPGFRGVFFAETEHGRAVLTLWADQAAIDALDSSSDYNDTVAAIAAAGFLRPPQSVEVLPVHQAWLATDLTAPRHPQ